MKAKKWNVRKIGDTRTLLYYDLKTKKEAMAIVEEWNRNPNHEIKLEIVEVR